MLAIAGYAFAYVAGEVEEGAALVPRAINLGPNLATARYWRGWAHIFLGDVDAGIEQFQVALRLSPLDPRIYVIQAGMAYGHFFAGRNEEASTWAATVIRRQSNFLIAQRIMMACHAMSGRVSEARQTCLPLLKLDPTLRISRNQGQDPISQERYRKIGASLPDRGRARMTLHDTFEACRTS